MRFGFHQFPTCLAFLPGIAAGWLLGGASLSGSSTPLASEAPISKASRGAAEESSQPEEGASAGSNRLRLKASRLEILRGSYRKLTLDSTSFGVSATAAQTDSSFEILRQVLDLTSAEESALRKGLEDGAVRLRDFERSNLAGFSVSEDRIAFRIPPAGGFRDELAESMRLEQKTILGEDRAAVFAALTGMATFSQLPENFAGLVEFKSDQEQTWISTCFDGMAFRSDSRSNGISNYSFFGGRFDHLIDEAAKERFMTR